MKNTFTKDQLKEIYELKEKGMSVKEISLKTGINYERLKKRLQRHPTYDDVQVVVHRCQNCGKVFSPRGEVPKRFCCEECRKEYWSHHRKIMTRDSSKPVVCLECGRTFINYGRKKASFCCRECFQNYARRNYRKSER